MTIDSKAVMQDRIQHIRSHFNLDAFIRRAIATKVHSAWQVSISREDHDRRDRMNTIMNEWDYELARQYVLSPVERDKVRDALAAMPDNIRDDLDTQQYRLRTGVYARLGAEHRRRVCEIRCWLIDAIDAIDGLQFDEARRLIVDAEHSLSFLMNARPQNDRPSRSRMENDHLLRERTLQIVQALRRDAMALRGVSA